MAASPSNSFINAMIWVLGGLSIAITIFGMCSYKKFKREKIKKHLAMETARAVVITHWTKKVTVEKPNIENGSVAGSVSEPLVIESLSNIM